jgi:hypothetical protein
MFNRIEPKQSMPADLKIVEFVRRREQVVTLLEEERNERIHTADTAAFVRACAGLLDAQLPNLPPRTSSGLVQQQAEFRKVASRLKNEM